MWNLEKHDRWTYLQGRNRDADTEKGRVDTAVRVGGMNWQIGFDMNILPRVNR